MRYRIVIEGEATDPPPDYPATLRKVVQQETKFMLGKAWDVVSVEELLIDDRVNEIVEIPAESLWRGGSVIKAQPFGEWKGERS
jgi:hypothetical protein